MAKFKVTDEMVDVLVSHLEKLSSDKVLMNFVCDHDLDYIHTTRDELKFAAAHLKEVAKDEYIVTFIHACWVVLEKIKDPKRPHELPITELELSRGYLKLLNVLGVAIKDYFEPPKPSKKLQDKLNRLLD